LIKQRYVKELHISTENSLSTKFHRHKVGFNRQTVFYIISENVFWEP